VPVATQIGYDATSVNLDNVPKDGRIRALYTTGSNGVAATPAQFAANPGCLRIDQSPDNTALDETADFLDYEKSAATLADLAPWAKAAKANFKNGTRHGQRSPAIYASEDNLTAVANALVAGGVTSGVGLIVAGWGITLAQAEARVSVGTGPFPIVGWQYEDAGSYDIDVFSTPWLINVSKKVAPVPTPTPTPSPTAMVFTAIPLKICAAYTDGSGNLYVVGTDSSGELCESKRTNPAVAEWTAPYKIAGKTSN
jgi:hypothetical protein